MTGLELLGLAMLLVMLGAIFIGLPISFTLLFLALMFGYVGMGERVFNLAYLKTIGLMKQDELVAVPMFILMGFICDQAGLMERLSGRSATCLRRSRAHSTWSSSSRQRCSGSPRERSVQPSRCWASWPDR